MKKSILATSIAAVASCVLLSPFAMATQPNKGTKVFKVDCDSSPMALQKALLRKPNKDIKVLISGKCEGPVMIDRSREVTLQSATGDKAVLTSEITITGSKVILKNLHFDTDNHKIINIEHNSTVAIENLTSQFHYGLAEQKPHIQVLGNSSLMVSKQRAMDFRVRGSSYAQFNKGNQLLSLIISDTSSVLAKAASEFEKIDLWGNAHLETNDSVSITALSLFGQSSAEILSGQVSSLTLGGRTMFAAYQNSTLTGPYTFYTNNYIFEIVESSLNNWSSQTHPNALIIGSNAHVNGNTYEGWSWSGQDGSE